MHSAVERGAAALLAAVLLAACDDPTGGSRQNPEDRPQHSASSATTGDVPAVRRIGLDVRATGSFRAGAPIVITSTATARYGAASVEYDLVVLDEDPDAPRSVAQFRGGMGQGNRQQLTATLTFPQAGYYRVVAQTSSTPGQGAPQFTVGDTALIEGSSQVLYLLVDENGGRMTDGFDPAAIPAGRVPRFGGFGPFLAGRRGSAVPAAASVQSVPPSRAVGVTGGRFLYYNEDSRSYRPVPNAEVAVKCLDINGATVGTLAPRTASDGTFSFSCNSTYFDASIHLRTSSADVVGPGRAIAGIYYFNEGDGTAPVLYAENYYAAHVHVLLNRYIPVANSRFGTSRTRVPVIVHPTDSTFPIHYNQTHDTIRTNFKRVFKQDGTFVTVHEYGHSFQWRAIEAPADYYCNPTGEHVMNQQYTKSCAFVEGFATFFAAWVAGDSLNGSYGYSDYYVENQSWYSGKDGMQVEGAVAGFFYDFVDASTAPDGYYNETGSDDSWGDGVAYPASFLANVLRNCVTSGPSTSYTQLLGLDEVVYCLEGNTTAAAEASRLGWNTWWSASGVTRNVTPPTGYSTDAVRRMWKRNFYGVS
ncbi:MAG TPA: hypothetical protein VHG08_09010 [Longimicrobium sp.]|nr:hypothetical protein [Longimicrobium sp.]